MTTLQLQDVSKSYDGTAVLKKLSIDFEEQALTAIVGASGCGKSTLVRICNGLVHPDSGAVTALGETLADAHLPSLRRRMGYAVQGTGLFPHLTARQNITLSATLAKWSTEEIDTRLNELLALMHLDSSLLDRHPFQLSGGQQQRVGLCRAMMLGPEVLLLDEPFAAIDPITRFEIHQQLMDALNEEPATVVLVTHDMREALKLADQIVVMQSGEIKIQASAAELVASRPNLEPEALLQQLMAELR